MSDDNKPITNELVVKTYAHCGLCLREKPPNISPRDYARLSVGFTDQGLQVWCVRHDCNVLHVDFEGHCHPANTSRRGPSGLAS